MSKRSPSPSSTAAAALVALAALINGCRCSSKPSDEQRLKERVDTTPVHLYLALKVAVARAGDDPAVAKARRGLLALMTAISRSRNPDAKGASNARTKLSLGDMARLAKAVYGLKKSGQNIARAGGEDQYPRALPSLLRALKARPELVEAIDVNTEHALFFIGMWALKIHPKAPVPVPVEVLLYEAYHTDPDRVSIPGGGLPIRAGRAWLYGNSDLCDLAGRDAAALDKQPFHAKSYAKGLQLLLAGAPKISAARLEQIDAGLRALGHGGVAICWLQRNDLDQARPSVKRVVELGEQAGVEGRPNQYLRTFVECGGSEAEVAAGRARLSKMKPGEDLAPLRAYCEARAENRGELARKLSLTAKLLQIGLHQLAASGASDELARCSVYSAVAGFAGVLDKVAGSVDKTSGALDRLKEGLQGLWGSGGGKGKGKGEGEATKSE